MSRSHPPFSLFSKTAFAELCRTEELPLPVEEYRFHPHRRWRFDYAWPELKIALEVEGGAWTMGRHTRAVGFIKDMDKYNAAAVLGWRVLRIVPDELLKISTINMVKQAAAL